VSRRVTRIHSINASQSQKFLINLLEGLDLKMLHYIPDVRSNIDRVTMRVAMEDAFYDGDPQKLLLVVLTYFRPQPCEQCASWIHSGEYDYQKRRNRATYTLI
jgi:hypothetical protein